jgi:hypothetical protein
MDLDGVMLEKGKGVIAENLLKTRLKFLLSIHISGVI